MSTIEVQAPLMTPNAVRSRAKVLARQHRMMRSELVQLRREGGLTQGDIAELMGVTQQAVSKFERYDSDPKLSTVRRYANAVGALVEHRVERDYGQSISLATAKSDWVPVGMIAFFDVGQVPARPSLGSSASWSPIESNRSDYALVG